MASDKWNRLAIAFALALSGCAASDPGVPLVPPALPVREPWVLEGCAASMAGWAVPVEQVRPLVAPYVPFEYAGESIFFFRPLYCESAIAGPVSARGAGGGAALVTVEAPSETHGVGSEQWLVATHFFGFDGPVAERLVAHGFRHVSATVEVEERMIAPGVKEAIWRYEEERGSIEMTFRVPDAPRDIAWSTALLAPTDGFSAIWGPGVATERAPAVATVAFDGVTFLSDLTLDETPPYTRYHDALGLDFMFEDARDR